MKKQIYICLFFLFAQFVSAEGPIAWETLPSIPDEKGFAGPFAGVIDGNLIVAGGANFPESPPWEGGKKVWYDKVFLLASDSDKWTLPDFKLPKALGYGVSLSLPWRNSIVMLGGSDSENLPDAQAIELFYEEGNFRTEKLPDLPLPLAEFSGVTFGSSLYIFSGRTRTGTVKKAYRLNLRESQMKWREISWPEEARGRMHSVAGVRDGTIYLFGGRDYIAKATDFHPEDRFTEEGLDFLRDCWKLNPKTQEWSRIADLPRGFSAAPSTAIPVGNSHLVMLGGVDAEFVQSQIVARPEVNGQGNDHPGFPPALWGYHVTTDSWIEVGSFPRELSVPVTVPVVPTGANSFVIPSGEIKPGIRTSQVLAGKVQANRASFGIINWSVVICYLGFMVLIGYWFMKAESAVSTEAYFRGGQQIPWWAAGLSIFATMLSAITFMAIPAKAYSDNINPWIGNWVIILIVPIVVTFYLPFFRRLNVTSAYEFLEERFNLASRLVASALFMLFHVGRVAIVLYLPALALSSATDINIYLAILAIGVLCILYTVMGGIEAVVWTDAIQAVVLLCGALACFIIIIFRLDGGIFTLVEIAQSDSKGLTADWFSLDVSSSTTSGLIIFIGFFFATLPSYTAGQDVVQRYVTTPSEKEAARSLWLNIPMVFFGSMLFFFLGVALYAFYKTNPELLDPALERNDGILPFFILQNMPVGVAGLIVAGIFAAAQSTISSSLNSVATAFVTDFYSRCLRQDTSDSHRLLVARKVVVILGTVGILLAATIAVTGIKSAFDAFNTFIGMALGPVGGMFFLGVFIKRATGSAALIGALVGFLTVLLVHYLRNLGVYDLWPILNGTISFLTTVIVGMAIGSAAAPAPSKW
ncbi:MAG: sodium/solute symporter [Verrucomicrobiales bacterium]|nr:sodium/solute symporter [Verrucomicrobiales bacterium]